MVKNKIAQRAVAAGLTGLMAFGAAAPAALATGIDVKDFSFYNKNSNDDGDYFKRIGGDTRYDTMKKIVEAYTDYTKASTKATILDGYGTKDYWTYHSTVVLASGDNFPDALAANGLAGYLTNEKLSVGKGENTDAVPVVLTKQGSLSSQAKDLLKQMQVQNVIIMGGTAAVSQDVEDAINKMGIGTQRVAGKDRQETSLKALQRINGNWEGRKGTYDLIIATGDNYADALSISPYAYRMGTPVILTKKDGTLTDDQVAAIKANDKIAEIVIVGGTDAVSDAVMGQIGTLRNNSVGIHYTRLAGVDRYETSAKIAEFEVAAWTDYFNQFWTRGTKFSNYRDYPGSIWSLLGYANSFSFDHVVVARGDNFPDALVGGQLAGGVDFWNVDGFEGTRWNPCPLLLTKDGDTRAENVIASQISKKRVAVDFDYYFSNDEWNTWVKDKFALVDGVYNALHDKWYTYATDWTISATGAKYGKKYAYDEFPFYVSIDGLVNGVTTSDTVVYPETAIKYTVTQQNGQVIFTLLDKDDAIVKSVDFRDDGITITLTDEAAKKYGNTCRISAADLEEQIGKDKWNKVTGEILTATIRLSDEPTGMVVAGTIPDKYVIRYVAETENFYGIILGGTDAVSNKKRDDLDDAVASHLSVSNLYLDDSINLTDKDFGVNIHYTRLKYTGTSSDLTVDYFDVAGTNDTVEHNNVTGVWTYKKA